MGLCHFNNGLSSLEIKKALGKNKIKVLFLIEADDFLVEDEELENTFIIYIGHNGDKFAGKSDVVLPTSAYTEKKALYLNLEGRPQFTKIVTSKPGLAVDSWKVFKALDQKLSAVIKYNTYDELLEKMYNDFPQLIGQMKKNPKNQNGK